MFEDHRDIQSSYQSCHACESLVPAAEMLLADGGPVCYGCGMEARGYIACDVEIEVGA